MVKMSIDFIVENGDIENKIANQCLRHVGQLAHVSTKQDDQQLAWMPGKVVSCHVCNLPEAELRVSE